MNSMWQIGKQRVNSSNDMAAAGAGKSFSSPGEQYKSKKRPGEQKLFSANRVAIHKSVPRCLPVLFGGHASQSRDSTQARVVGV